jgi:anti-sigma-K factor RskA
MNIRHNTALRHKLASEYALGTLRGGARRRFEGWLHQDADLRRLTAQWQAKLGSMAELAGSVKPPKTVWKSIEQRLSLKRPPRLWEFWRNDNLTFWRNLGMVSTAFATVLVVVVMSKSIDPPIVNFVATLQDAETNTAMVITADSRHGKMDVRLVNSAQFAKDRSLQLWAVPVAGAPRSLGVMVSAHTRFAIQKTATANDVVMLAVSLEPKGGSPDPAGPTGPVLYKGPWVKL